MASPNEQPAVTSDMCHTKVHLQKTNYLWIIDDYKLVHNKRGCAIQSLPFSADDDEFKWHLGLHPNYNGTGWISLHLQANNLSNLKVYCPISGNVQTSIISAENEKTRTQNVEFTLVSATTTLCSGFNSFIKTSDLFNEANKLLPQDQLRIICELSYVKKTDIINIPSQSFSTLYQKNQSIWLEDIESLFMDEEFSDVIVCINGKDYHAHKSILAASSSVFKTMLRTDMIEKKSNRIEISDIDESVFMEMLRYIYTGKAEKLDTIVSELLAAADKYNLKKLKIICEKKLLENLSKKNVVNILILADRYNAEDLKTEAIQFIKLNSYSTSILTKEVRNDLVTYPHLLLEILDTFNNVSIEEH